MLKIKVKVGNITNLSDARYCAGMGVELLGFPVGPHHGIDPKKYKEITDWVSGPAFVLEWTGEEIPDNFADIIQPYNADYIQIGANQIQNIPALIVRLIIALPISDWRSLYPTLKANKDRIGYLILNHTVDSPIDPVLIGGIGKEFSVLLEFGVLEKNMDALSGLSIVGIALEGTAESKPGLQDYSHLSEILERLEVGE